MSLALGLVVGSIGLGAWGCANLGDDEPRRPAPLPEPQRSAEAIDPAGARGALDTVLRSLEEPVDYDVGQVTFQVRTDSASGAWIDAFVFGPLAEVPRLDVLRQRLGDLAVDPASRDQGVIGNVEAPARSRIQVGAGRVLQEYVDPRGLVHAAALRTRDFTLHFSEADAVLSVLPRSSGLLLYDPGAILSPLPLGPRHREALTRATWTTATIDAADPARTLHLIEAVLEGTTPEHPWREIVLAGAPVALPVCCRVVESLSPSRIGTCTLYEWSGDGDSVQLTASAHIAPSRGIWLVTIFERSNIARRDPTVAPTLSLPAVYRVVDQIGTPDEIHDELASVPDPLATSIEKVVRTRD